MNIGARQSTARTYDTEQIRADYYPDTVDMESVKQSILHEAKSAYEWHEDRGTAGDNVDREQLGKLIRCVRAERWDEALTVAVDIMSGQLHPTARDIVTTAPKLLIYNACGKRAHTYRTDNE
ncbi:hypothetical protein [Halosegnis longus]|uniref:hypothetical protein n=1 Tax=Halosegnis longus TaxID=2216012 RepID=UPI00129E1198|nr:hypothetical protein [Halosegnis longus]